MCLSLYVAAKRLDVSIERVKRLLDSGELTGYQLGMERCVVEDDKWAEVCARIEQDFRAPPGLAVHRDA